MKYKINMIRAQLLEKKRTDRQKSLLFSSTIIAFAILALALFYSILQVRSMEMIIKSEEAKLKRIEDEFKNYEKTKMIIDRKDIELLDRLQHSRIYWTKKLVAMASHLPEDYWITKFQYDRKNVFEVKGYGYISKDQKQLLTLDEYLNKLRDDSTYNDDFGYTYLKTTIRTDEKTRDRVSFEYGAEKAKRRTK